MLYADQTSINLRFLICSLVSPHWQPWQGGDRFQRCRFAWSRWRPFKMKSSCCGRRRRNRALKGPECSMWTWHCGGCAFRGPGYIQWFQLDYLLLLLDFTQTENCCEDQQKYPHLARVSVFLPRSFSLSFPSAQNETIELLFWNQSSWITTRTLT